MVSCWWVPPRRRVDSSGPHANAAPSIVQTGNARDQQSCGLIPDASVGSSEPLIKKLSESIRSGHTEGQSVWKKCPGRVVDLSHSFHDKTDKNESVNYNCVITLIKVEVVFILFGSVQRFAYFSTTCIKLLSHVDLLT